MPCSSPKNVRKTAIPALEEPVSARFSARKKYFKKS
jgi:hypothetical protein